MLLRYVVRFVVLSASLSAACTDGDGSAECRTTSDCPAGRVCLNGVCDPLCKNDSDCGHGFICEESVCKSWGQSAPIMDHVDGDSATECPDTPNAPHCIATGLRVTGKNLAGASFSWTAASGGTPETLSVRPDSTNTVAELDWPTAAQSAAGKYILTATNDTGSSAKEVELLQGPPGPDLTADQIISRINTDGTTQLKSDMIELDAYCTNAAVNAGLATKAQAIHAHETGTGLSGQGTSTSPWAIDTSAVQARVTGTCVDGIQSIGVDGQPTCRPELPRDIYTHWGYANCADGDEVLYTGTAYGGWQSHIGGTTKPICYQPNDPAPQYNQSNHGTYLVALGMYYSGNDTVHQVPGVTARRSIPCAKCATARVCYDAIGTDQCANGWTAAYTGLLAGGYYNWESDLDTFCYDLNNDAPETPHGDQNQVFSASTGAPGHMAGDVKGYRHTKCAICCK